MSIQNLPLSAETLLNEFADAPMVVSLDGEILFWSQGAASIFGFTQEEPLDQSLVETLVPSEYRMEGKF